MNAVVAFAARSSQQLSTFAVTLLAAAYLSPAEYGVFTLAAVFVGLVQMLVYTGLYDFVVTRKGEERAVLDTAFWLMMALSVAAAVLLIALAPGAVAVFDAPDLAPVLTWLAILQPVAAVNAWCAAVLLRRNRLQVNFAIMLAETLVGFAAGVVLLVLWQSVFALVAYRAVRIVAAAALYLPLTRAWPGGRGRKAVAREAMSYASALYGSRALSFLSNYGADLALGALFSTAEAGLWRFGNRVATGAMEIVVQPIGAFALAQLGRANRNGLPFEPVLRRFASTTLVLTGAVAAVILVFAEAAAVLLFGAAYLPALAVAHARAVAGAGTIGVLLLEPLLAASGRTGASMTFVGGFATAQLLTVALVAPYGLAALAWSMTAVGLVASAAAFIVIRRVAGVPIRGALAGLLRAAVVVALYGAVASACWQAAQAALGPGVSSLVLGLALAGLAGLAHLAAAARVRVFDLRAFSG
jgi:O-antigen/teichoic acid export membrane protein